MQQPGKWGFVSPDKGKLRGVAYPDRPGVGAATPGARLRISRSRCGQSVMIPDRKES